MTIATEIPIQQQLLSFGDFIVRYGDSNRYELIDGEVFDLEPTGYRKLPTTSLRVSGGF
jgi:hypothetical protein